MGKNETETKRDYDLQTEIMGVLSDAQGHMRKCENVKAYELITLAKVYILEADLTKRVTKEDLKRFQLTAMMFD